MEPDLELVRFTLTPEMSFELIRFNEVKKEISKLNKLYELNNDKLLLKKIKKLELELVNHKNNFINEFRIINREEILDYLNKKDQI